MFMILKHIKFNLTEVDNHVQVYELVTAEEKK